jgi:protein TonB
MRLRPLATLAASVALHAAALLAVVLLVTRESELGALFIDLTRGAGGGESEATGGGAGDGARARASAPRMLRAARAVEPPAPRRTPPADEPVSPPPAPSEPPTAPAAAAAPSPSGAVIAEEAGDAAAPGAPERSGAAAAAQGATSATGAIMEGVGVRGGGDVGAAPDASRGLALAGSGTGAPGAEYGPYLTRLRQRVQVSLRYPAAARRRGLQGIVALEIVIRPDGTVDAVVLADSSAHGLLDEAALETVRRLAPEPFPAGVAPRLLRVRLPVVFTLE